jgi:hypothetical protein
LLSSPRGIGDIDHSSVADAIDRLLSTTASTKPLEVVFIKEKPALSAVLHHRKTEASEVEGVNVSPFIHEVNFPEQDLICCGLDQAPGVKAKPESQDKVAGMSRHQKARALPALPSIAKAARELSGSPAQGRIDVGSRVEAVQEIKECCKIGDYGTVEDTKEEKIWVRWDRTGELTWTKLKRIQKYLKKQAKADRAHEEAAASQRSSEKEPRTIALIHGPLEQSCNHGESAPLPSSTGISHRRGNDSVTTPPLTSRQTKKRHKLSKSAPATARYEAVPISACVPSQIRSSVKSAEFAKTTCRDNDAIAQSSASRHSDDSAVNASMVMDIGEAEFFGESKEENVQDGKLLIPENLVHIGSSP